MISKTCYVPILKAKAGELGACSALSTTSKAAVRPILEVTPMEWDFATEAPKLTLTDHVTKTVNAVSKAVGKDFRTAIDTELLDQDLGTIYTIGQILDGLRAAGTPQIPTTSLARNGVHQALVKKAIASDNLGVCIRLDEDDFIDLGSLPKKLESLIASLEVHPTNVDLVIDVGAITDEQVTLTTTAVTTWLGAIPRPMEWRTVAVAATAFPVNLSGLKSATVTSIPRSEWSFWKQLYAKAAELSRMPIFGDYGISNPEMTELDPRLMRPAAGIRYTAEASWIVFKGKSVRDIGFNQMHTICQVLVKHKDYSGKSFSSGDEWIDKCAAKVAGPGNLTTHRQVGTNHHLEFVVDQLAKFPVP